VLLDSIDDSIHLYRPRRPRAFAEQVYLTPCERGGQESTHRIAVRGKIPRKTGVER
jgi:hypothetical protein